MGLLGRDDEEPGARILVQIRPQRNRLRSFLSRDFETALYFRETKGAPNEDSWSSRLVASGGLLSALHLYPKDPDSLLESARFETWSIYLHRPRSLFMDSYPDRLEDRATGCDVSRSPFNDRSTRVRARRLLRGSQESSLIFNVRLCPSKL